MALQTLPAFTPSGYLLFSTAMVTNQVVSITGLPYTSTPYSAPTARALPAGSAPDKAVIINLGPELVFVVLAAAVATTTGTAASGSTQVTVASAASIAVGQVAVGAGVPDGTIVQAIAGTLVTLSQATTAPLSTTTLNFVTAVTPQSGIPVPPSPAPLTVLAYVSSGFVCAFSNNSARGAQIGVTVGV